MTNENPAEFNYDFSVPGKPIVPQSKTDGNVFGLVPAGSVLTGTGDAPWLEPANIVYYGAREGVVVDPLFANTDLFSAESYGDVAVIRPKQSGIYRIDFHCSYRIELVEDGTSGLAPYISVTNFLETGIEAIGRIYNTFAPTATTVHAHAVSRLSRLEENTPVVVRFAFTGVGLKFRAWQGTGDDSGVRTGFYLTKL